MQRVLVIAVVTLLVVASIGVGALTANWPFWRRAWMWHAADGGWPSALPGPHAVVRGAGGVPLAFAPAMDDMQAVAAAARTHLLLRARGNSADAWIAPGNSHDDVIDGRGLAPAVLTALFAQLEQQHPGLLDQPAGAWIDAWRQDVRGATTPRQLLALLEAGIARPYAFAPLNPFSQAARLAAGPDFHGAGISLFDTRAPGGSATQAAAAQVLASIAAAAANAPFAAVLERELWSTLAAGDALLLLDRRRGAAALHCCVRATAADWLRLGLRLAMQRPGDDRGSPVALNTIGRVLLAGPGPAALLWVGEGDPPSGLETLLGAAKPVPVQ